MAAVLETLTIPRGSGLPAATMSRVAYFPISRLSGCRNTVNLPESRGLKVQSLGSSASVSLRSKLRRRGQRIVCEAQETAVQDLHSSGKNNGLSFSTVGSS